MGRVDIIGLGRQDNVAGYRPTLLREPGHIQHRATQVGKMGCHADDGTRGHYTRAANTCQHDAEMVLERTNLGFEQ